MAAARDSTAVGLSIDGALTRLVEEALHFQEIRQRCLQALDLLGRQSEIGPARRCPLLLDETADEPAGMGKGPAVFGVDLLAIAADFAVGGFVRLEADASDLIHFVLRDVRVFGAMQAAEARHLAAPSPNDEACAMLLQDALHTLDGVALAIKELAYSAQKVDVVGAVVTPAAAAFHRPDLREASFPKSQHMLRKIEILRNFADRSECVWPLGHRRSSNGRLVFGTPTTGPVHQRRVYSLLEDIARLEHHNPSRRNWHLFSCLRVPADPLTLLADDERAE